MDDSTNISKNSDSGKVAAMVSFIIDYVTVSTIKCTRHYCIHEFLETFRGNIKLNETKKLDTSFVSCSMQETSAAQRIKQVSVVWSDSTR